MAKDPKNPAAGDLQIDCTPIANLLTDLPPGAMTGMRREREGLDTVLTEVASQQKANGARAGILDSDVQSLRSLTDQIAQIRKYKEPARKLLRCV